MNKHVLKIAITKRNCKTLTDIRTVIFLQKYKDRYGKFPNRQKILDLVFEDKNISWQKRKQWIDNIIDYQGSKKEHPDYLAVLYNSKEKADAMAQAKSDRIKGANNPGYQHGGKFSAFSDKFIGTTTKEEAAKKSKETKTANPHNENTKIEYYTSRGYSEEEAKVMLAERQNTSSKQKYIERYGEEEGAKKREEQNINWQNKLHENGRNAAESTIEKNIFEIIKRKYPNAKTQIVLQNKENQSWRQFDIGVGNKIIEINGDYFHANPNKYQATDLI